MPLQVELYPKQRDFLKSKALFRAFAAGIGSGKSWVGSYDLICRGIPGRLYMVVAPTYTILADATFRSFLSVADSLGLIQNNSQVKRSPPPQIKLPTGIEIIFRSGEIPDRLRGPNLSGIWLDEASLMPQEILKICVGRLRQEGEIGWMTATFTPKGKAHWTYKVFGTGAENTELIRAKTRENPFIPPEFEKTVRSQLSSREAEQELEGAFLDMGGNHFRPSEWPKYTPHSDAISVGRSPAREIIHHHNIMILTAIDIATGKKKDSDKTAIITAGMDHDGRLFIFDVFNGNIRLEDIGRVLNGICENWKPLVVAGEDDNLSVAMLLEYRRWKHIPEVRCLPIRGQAKIIRAQEAIILGENGRIFLPERAPWLEDYCDQLSSFTGIEPGETDDLVDATGVLCRLANLLKPPMSYLVEEPAILLPGKAEIYYAETSNTERG